MRAALDLLARIELDSPQKIYDLGCGTGNTTNLLLERWPGVQVIGIDSSFEMLEKARKCCPEVEFVKGEISTWNPGTIVDLIYSNSAIHWLDDHKKLFPRLGRILMKSGQLAVQMPRNFDAPSHKAIRETVESGPWSDRLKPALRPSPVAEPEVYYELLKPITDRLDIWETVYLQTLTGENAVVEWTLGTALRPILNFLKPKEQEQFLEDYSVRILKSYR